MPALHPFTFLMFFKSCNIVDTVFILLLALWYYTVLCVELKDHRYQYSLFLASIVVAVSPFFHIAAITLHWSGCVFLCCHQTFHAHSQFALFELGITIYYLTIVAV